MKDQYAGDFGDYVKLALLRRLMPGHRLAVGWYRTPNDPDRRDGLHVEYLSAGQEDRWKHYDPVLYDHLRDLVHGETRSILRLQEILLADGNSFFDNELRSRAERAPWFALFSRSLPDDKALLFLDPDNGIASPRFSGSTASVTCEEIAYLRGGTRTIIIYHHHTRAKGGHIAELKEIASRLMPSHTHQAVCALRAPGWSPRSFFIVGPTRPLWDRAQLFARDWEPHVTFHALTEVPDDIGLTPGHDAYQRVAMLEARGILDIMTDKLVAKIGPAADMPA